MNFLLMYLVDTVMGGDKEEEEEQGEKLELYWGPPWV